MTNRIAEITARATAAMDNPEMRKLAEDNLKLLSALTQAQRERDAAINDMERLTKRAPNGLAYLVKVKQNEQAVECKYKNTLDCILESFQRLADLEDQLESGELARVVRCKDCEFYHGGYCGFHSKLTDKTEPLHMDKMDYCSEGEPKDCGAKMDHPTKINGGATNV